jgi:hypothetical protein
MRRREIPISARPGAGERTWTVQTTGRLFALIITTILVIAGCSMDSTVGGDQNSSGSQPSGGSQDSGGRSSETSSASHHYQLDTRSKCESATGNPTVCTVVITNDSSSTDDFNWEVSSEPNVASVDPSSGIVPRGSASDEITITVPSGSPCPVTVAFTDSSTNGTTIVKVTSVDGKSC